MTGIFMKGTNFDKILTICWGMSSYNRGCIIGIILGCSIYAFFILFYKQINTESLQHLKQVRKDCRFTLL